jgi:hypothetical protein
MVTKLIEDILVMKDFDQQKWTNAVKQFINQFDLDKIEISEIENYEKIKSCVIKYFDSDPEELNKFNTLLEHSKTNLLEN